VIEQFQQRTDAMLPDTVDGNRSMPAFCSMEQAPKYISKHGESVNRPSVFCSYYNGFITCPLILEIVTIRVAVRNIRDFSTLELRYHVINVLLFAAYCLLTKSVAA
jgi:hypothetical protein